MIEINFSNGVNEIYLVDQLTQWDYGVKIKASGFDIGNSNQVHFKYGDVALVVSPSVYDDYIVVSIPNELLMLSGELVAYIYIVDNNGGKTVKTIKMPITAREQPENYTPTETDPTLAQLLAMIDEKADKDEIGDLVDEYLEDNPISGVTDEQIANAVSEYLEENPVESLTVEEVDTIVAEYVEAHKDELKGEDGKDGKDGINGVDGKDGKDGVNGTNGTNGTDGKDGEDGADGISPIITVTEIENGYTLNIMDASGTKSVNIYNGQDGEDGADGSGVSGDYIPKTTTVDYSWWGTKSALSGNVKIATASNGKRYSYSENSEGYFSPAYQSCDIYQVGILADGSTNNANAKQYNMTDGGNLLLKDGMYIAVAGGQSGNNRWHSYDSNTGGHCFEGWAKDGMQRLTMLLNEPKREDGLKEIAIFSWDRRMRDFGWTRVGCDGMYTKKSDGSYEIKDNDKEGFAFTRSFAIGHTPLQFEPMAKPQYMPGFVPNGLQTDATDTEVPDGTVYFSESDNMLHIKINGTWKHFLTENDDGVVDVMPTDITINADTTTVEKDSTLTLTATITPSNTTNKGIVWTTNADSIASVNNGVVTGISAGDVIITATCAADSTKSSSVTITVTDNSSSGGDDTPDTPTEGITILASKSGLSKDYTITDGYTYFTCFKWGDDDYIITSNRLIGYAGGQFRTRPQIATNIYNNGTLAKSTNDGDAQQSIAWGISDSTIKCNANMISYMSGSSTDDASADVTFAKNYE